MFPKALAHVSWEIEDCMGEPAPHRRPGGFKRRRSGTTADAPNGDKTIIGAQAATNQHAPQAFG
eukprot:12212197-Alexandrium_andersonii.AAC.1